MAQNRRISQRLKESGVQVKNLNDAAAEQNWNIKGFFEKK